MIIEIINDNRYYQHFIDLINKLDIKEAEIKNQREKLDEELTPKFGSIMITDIQQEIKSLNFEVEGKKLVNDIMDVIRLSFGDITALPTLLARINLNLSACWTKASNKTYFDCR